METERLILVPGSAELSLAELAGGREPGHPLGAEVGEWPPPFNDEGSPRWSLELERPDGYGPGVSSERPILVTGAAGKTGRAVLGALRAHGAPVRGAVRRSEQERQALEAGAGRAMVVDLEEPGRLERAMRGCRAVYFICPNMHPREAELGRAAIEAATEAGVERFVYHSVLHPHAERMPHHWSKLRVEEALLESRLEWTVLQPTAYMQNLLGQWNEIVETGCYRVPYPVSSRISLVDLDDVAEVAVEVLTGAGHAASAYPLAGGEPLDQRQVAAVLGRGLGRPVRALQASGPAEVERALVASGTGAYARETLLAMFDYYGRFGLRGNSNTLSWLLRRPPTCLADFVRRIVDE